MTVDPDLVTAGNKAVASGRAESLSGWVNDALIERAARDRRLDALAAAVSDFEAEFGQIGEEEIAALQRSDREGAAVVRGRRAGSKRRPGTGAA